VDTTEDRELELVLSRAWHPESYRTMINSGRLDLTALSNNYSFNAGVANGRALIHLEKESVEFPYRRIVKTGERSWQFEGSSLSVILRSESQLEVQWTDENNIQKTETFVTLSVPIENVVTQERERRQNKLLAIYNRGPRYISSNYGDLILNASGGFTWNGINLLPDGMLSETVLGSGALDIDYSLSGEIANRYTDAIGLRLDTVRGHQTTLVFIYILDNQGLRMEYIPSDLISGRTVNRRPSSPFVIYFSPEY
jgi:hypothetical protein